ncbi:MAG: hypothetical protein ACREQI_12450 [Candidatus Binataceae bacterium]
MVCENGLRFKTTQDALRFYFRVHNALYGGRRRHPPPGLPADAIQSRAGAFDDYRSIGWCMRGLDDIEFFLLGELYGPGWFGTHRNGTAIERLATEPAFGLRKIPAPAAATMHRGALAVVGRRLLGLGLVPPDGGVAEPPDDARVPAELFRTLDFPVRWDFAEVPAKRIVQGR